MAFQQLLFIERYPSKSYGCRQRYNRQAIKVASRFKDVTRLALGDLRFMLISVRYNPQREIDTSWRLKSKKSLV